jgi:hypothetical protein
MYRDLQREQINKLIKTLETIRDTDEIDEFDVSPHHETDSFQMMDGTTYVLLSTTIEIKHKRVYQKGDIFDDFLYKPV